MLRALLDTGVSVLVIALQWREGDDEDAVDTIAAAASVGAAVTAVRPGDDLGIALRHGVGAGSR